MNINKVILQGIFFDPKIATREGGIAMWFSDTAFLPSFLVIFFIASVFIFYKNVYYLSYLGTFGLSYFILVSIVKELNPRYVFYFCPFYVLTFASSIYLFFKLIRVIIKKHKLSFITLCIFLLFIFNPGVSLKLLSHQIVIPVDDRNDKSKIF